MPFAQIHKNIPDAKFSLLRDQLVQEWALQRIGLTEPIIIEEAAPLYKDLLRLDVIWSEWSGIGQRERSRVIMDAYQLSHPESSNDVAAVTVAMGLTPEEAQRMGIEYAPLDAAI